MNNLMKVKKNKQKSKKQYLKISNKYKQINSNNPVKINKTYN